MVLSPQIHKNRVHDISVWMSGILSNFRDRKNIIEGRDIELSINFPEIYRIINHPSAFLNFMTLPESRSLPISRDEKTSTILSFVIPFIKAGENRDLKCDLPDTAPLSGAEILILKDRERNNKFILKLMSKNGVNEISNLLAANRKLSKRGIKTPYVLAVGAYTIAGVVNGHYILMSIAEGQSFDSLVRNKSELAYDAISTLGLVLGELHISTYKERMSLSEISEQSSILYEAKRYCASGIFISEKLENLTLIGGDAQRFLQEKIAETAIDFYRLVLGGGLRQLFTCVTHGDAHIGNFFYNPEPLGLRKIEVIDTETLTWSNNADSISADDIGRVIGSIWVNSYLLNIPSRIEKREFAVKLTIFFFDNYLRITRTVKAIRNYKESFELSFLYMFYKYICKNCETQFLEQKGELFSHNMQDMVNDLIGLNPFLQKELGFMKPLM